MPFFIHDVGHGIKTPIDIHRIANRLRKPAQIATTSKTDSALSKELDPQTQRDSLKIQHRSAGDRTNKNRPYSEAEEDMTAQNIMSSPVIAVFSWTTVEQALAEMRIHEFRHLVVVDAEYYVLGVVEKSDLILSKKSGDGSTIEQANQRQNVIQPAISATANTPIARVAQALLQSGLEVILVSEQEEIVGIITPTSFVQLIAKASSYEAEA
ncbi:MAG: hypothetical protein CSA50_05940 [Gammaproteobacteria bacterium]|nr:MAG: hypothetical protein CSA50_05940 [Gammaproteobacteria bacterium]